MSIFRFDKNQITMKNLIPDTLLILSLLIAILAMGTKIGNLMTIYSYTIPGTNTVRTDTVKPDVFNVIFRPWETTNELKNDVEVKAIRLAMHGCTLQNVRTTVTNGQTREHRATLMMISLILFGMALMWNHPGQIE